MPKVQIKERTMDVGSVEGFLSRFRRLLNLW
jgi:hypothetical protein